MARMNPCRAAKAASPRSVVMCGPALNQANMGDRLLVNALTTILRNDLGVQQVAYASVGVDVRVPRDMPRLEILDPRRQPMQLLWRTFRADAFIIAGAVSFHERRRIMLKQALLAWLCRLGGGRTVINAASIQPIRDWFCRLLFRATCSAADWFTVRDGPSAEHARALGLGSAPPRSPDPGVLCPLAPMERIREIFAGEGIPTDRPLVGIAPHFFVNHGRYYDAAYPGFEIEYEDFPDEVLDRCYESLARLADRMARFGRVVFLPMCTRTPPGDDREAADWIVRRMRRAEHVHVVRGEYLVGEMAGMLSQCTFLAASRLHAFAMGVAAGVPSLAIGFHPKVYGLAEELGLADWVYPIRDLSPEAIGDAADAILDGLCVARERVREGVSRAAGKARADFIQGVLGTVKPGSLDPREG